jgi:hypothetical protein
MNKIQVTLILALITIGAASDSQNVNFICEAVDVSIC